MTQKRNNPQTDEDQTAASHGREPNQQSGVQSQQGGKAPLPRGLGGEQLQQSHNPQSGQQGQREALVQNERQSGSQSGVGSHSGQRDNTSGRQSGNQ